MNLAHIETASDSIFESAITLLKDENGVHLETAVGGLAAVAGECTLLAVHPVTPLENDQDTERFIFHQDVNFALVEDSNQEDPNLLMFIYALSVSKLGLKEKHLPKIDRVFKNCAAHVGQRNWPYVSVKPAHYPHMWPLEFAARFRNSKELAISTYSLQNRDPAYAVLLAAIKAIHVGRASLSPEISVTLLVEILVAAAKSRPVTLSWVERNRT